MFAEGKIRPARRVRMGDVPQIALLIPILAIVLGIGVAFWAIYWGHQTRKLKYEERRHMIERGMVPPEMRSEDDEDEDDKPMTPEQCFKTGIIMTFLGVGLGLGYFVLRDSYDDGPPPWVLGVGGSIVGMIGLGNLVYFFLRKDHPPER
jgi:hypothetical protein